MLSFTTHPRNLWYPDVENYIFSSKLPAQNLFMRTPFTQVTPGTPRLPVSVVPGEQVGSAHSHDVHAYRSFCLSNIWCQVHNNKTTGITVPWETGRFRSPHDVHAYRSFCLSKIYYIISIISDTVVYIAQQQQYHGIHDTKHHAAFNTPICGVTNYILYCLLFLYWILILHF